MIFIYDHFKVVEAASTNFFFIIYNLFHTANQLYEDSYTSRTIASSQHHPRETRPLLSQPNLYKNRYIGIAYYEFVSYIRRNMSMFLLIHFLSFTYFFSFNFNFIYNMKLFWRESICLFILFHSSISFFLSFIFIYNMKLKSIYLLIHSIAFTYFFFFPLTSYII